MNGTGEINKLVGRSSENLHRQGLQTKLHFSEDNNSGVFMIFQVIIQGIKKGLFNIFSDKLTATQATYILK